MAYEHFELNSQIEQRTKLDREGVENAYQRLASSVKGDRFVPESSAEGEGPFDLAVRLCLRYLGTEPGKVPALCEEGPERLEYSCGSVGVMWRDVTLAGAWYRQSFGPMLAWLKTGEPVALVPKAMRGYNLVDPGEGVRVRVNREVAEQLQEGAICFYRPLPQGELGVGDLVRFLVSVFNMADYLHVFAVTLIATLVGLLPAWANQILFGTVIPSGKEDLIAPIACTLVGVLVARTVFGICQTIIMARVTTKVQVESEAAIMARLFSMSTGFFKDFAAGDLSNRVSAVPQLCRQLMSLLLGGGLTALLSLVYLIQIQAFAPELVAPAFAVVALDAAVIVTSSLINASYDRRMMESNSRLSGMVTGLLSAINKIKLAGAEDRAFAKWANGYAVYANAAYDRPRGVVGLPALITLVGMLGTVTMYFSASTSGVSVSDYMAFNVAYGQLVGAFSALAQQSADIAQIPATLRLLDPILRQSPELGTKRRPVHLAMGGFELTGVSFRYGENSPYVVRDLSFRVRPGEYVALVGRSGCGKSTILRILLGFEQPERGAVYYEGQNVSEMDLRSLRRQIGCVMQDGKLFLGTIYSNITIANPSATLDEAWKAAELAGVADDIRAMPMGMQTVVMEGTGGFSGGQLQRILIARAVCGGKKVLMFDEATSALDNVTQRQVSEALDSLRCTRFVIAHRLSTVRHCDRILVVDDGHIVEEGTYGELMAAHGLFFDLVERQRLGND